jgi:glycosyltransferase involved in cell wall biosynthesis
MSTAAPLASFVITCHNLGPYLDEAVDSVLAQTIEDYEIVVVNDGSTDEGTCSLLRTYSRPRTRVVHSERRGLPGARNLGVANSRAPYLCMVDADDILEPRYLERSLAAVQPSPDIAFASHWFRAFGEETWDWTPTDCTLATLLRENTVNGAALLRRDVFESLGGFDESFTDGCEDWEFWIRATAAGYHGTIIPEFLFRYRRRATSMSREMHRAPGMRTLHAQLMRRHESSFKAHVLPLLAARDSQIADLSARLWRQAAAGAEWRASRHWQADNRRLAAEVDVTRDLEAEVRRLHAAFNHEAEAAAALRQSWSWRLTAPLRAAFGLLRR